MERRMDRRERERERFRQQQQQQQHQQQSNLNDRVDLDARTPLAWQRRDFNYHHNSSSSFNERYPEGVPSSSSDRYSHPSLGSRSARSAIGGGGGGHNQSEHHRGQQQQHRGRGRGDHHQQQQTGSDDQTTSKMSVASSSRGGVGGGGGERASSKKTSTSSAGTASGGGGGGGGNRSNGSTAAAAASGRQHPSRSSEETTTGSASSETETDAERGQPPMSRPGTSGTLRSMQSMPLLTPLHHPGGAGFNPMLGGIYGVVGLPGPPPHMMQAPPGNPTWNGEPCPVHGAGLHHHGQPMSLSAYPAYPPPPQIYGGMAPMRRAASIHELGMTTPMPALMPPPGAIYGTIQAGPPPPGHQFLMSAPTGPEMMMMAMSGPPSLMAGPPPPPPSVLHHHLPLHPPPPASSIGGRMLMRPHPMSHRSNGPSSLPPIPLPPPSSMMGGGRNGRPIVVNGKNGQPEPLPVRDAPPLPPKIPPSDVVSRAASKSSSAKPFSYEACCRGNVVVLWVIMGIIGLGVVMAVVFYYAFQ